MSQGVAEQKVDEKAGGEGAGAAEGAPARPEAAAEGVEKREAQAEAKVEEKGEAEAVEERPKFKFERDYVVPLRRVYWLGRNRRAKRAIRLLKEFVLRHTKAERVILDNEVNEAIWSRSIKRPPRRIAIHVGVTEDKKAYVYLQRNNK